MTVPETIAILISLGSTVVAILAYRRAGTLKKLDQLVETGRAQNELRHSFNALTAIHNEAIRNRKAVMNAKGSHRSGAMQRMADEWDADAKVIATLESKITGTTQSAKSMSPISLANLLVEIDGVKRGIDDLLEKYREWDEWNKEQQKQIREAAHARLNR